MNVEAVLHFWSTSSTPRASEILKCYHLLFENEEWIFKNLVQKLSEKILDIPKSLLKWDESLWTIKTTFNFLQ